VQRQDARAGEGSRQRYGAYERNRWFEILSSVTYGARMLAQNQQAAFFHRSRRGSVARAAARRAPEILCGIFSVSRRQRHKVRPPFSRRCCRPRNPTQTRRFYVTARAASRSTLRLQRHARQHMLLQKRREEFARRRAVRRSMKVMAMADQAR